MSVALDPVDLSSAVVGSTGKLDWTGLIQQGSPIGVRAGKATLRIHNESNAGLKLQFSGLKSDRVPAGGWGDYELAGENLVNYVVEYLITGPAPNVLLGVVYEPGETVPPLQTLGNSSVGVGGTVTTSSASSIKNDGNNPPTSIVEATPGDQSSSSVALNNDASGFLKVLSANVLRTILNVVRGNSGVGKATVQLGDSGDPTITTMYGNLDKLRADAGALVSDGAGKLTAAHYMFPTPPGGGQGVLGWSTPGDILDVSSNSGNVNTYLKAGAGGLINLQIPNGTNVATVDGSGNVVANGTYNADGPATAAYYQANIPSTTADANAVVDMIDATTGAIRWQIGKMAHVNNDVFRVLDVTHAIACLSIRPNHGAFIVDGQIEDAGGTQYGRMSTAGGGAAGFITWEGTTDPGGSATEGDLWVGA